MRVRFVDNNCAFCCHIDEESACCSSGRRLRRVGCAGAVAGSFRGVGTC